MDDYICNLFISIAIGGIIVAVMNIQKAFLLGINITWLAMFSLFILSLSDVRITAFKDILKQNLIMVFTLILLVFYILIVWKNKEYISEGKMPSNWYTFAYFVLIAITGLIASLSTYMKNPNNKILQVIAGILFCCLLGFVIIETIIGTYYQTDGFMVKYK